MEAQLDLPAPNLTISVSVDISKQNKIREFKKKYVRNDPLDICTRLRYRVSHYIKDDTFHDTTSQYGDLTVLWKYFFEQFDWISS